MSNHIENKQCILFSLFMNYASLKKDCKLSRVVQTYNPNIQEAEGGDL